MPVVKITRTVMAGSREELAASVAFWQQRGWRPIGTPKSVANSSRTGEGWSQDMEYGTKSDGVNVVIPSSSPPGPATA